MLNDTRVDTSEENRDVASQRWNEWIKFFINAVIIQGNKNIKFIDSIDNLYNSTIDNSRKLITSNKLMDIINVMFEKPIFTKKTILERVEIPSSTLGVYLNKLEEEKLIYSDGKVRNKKYYFYDLINILRQQ